MILCGGLAEAVRCESVSAVAAHWGVAKETVWRWRKALGVPFFNEGTLMPLSRHDSRKGQPPESGPGSRSIAVTRIASQDECGKERETAASGVQSSGGSCSTPAEDRVFQAADR